MCFLGFEVQAQECVSPFIRNTIDVFNAKSKEFSKQVYEKVQIRNTQQVEFINIPVMFATKKGAKLFCSKSLKKEDLLCYLNVRKLQFDESFIYSDSIVVGAISRGMTYYGEKYEFYDKTTSYINFLYPLITEIRRIAPDFIFRIYNLSQCYWYIKDNQLYVLFFKHDELEIRDFKILKAVDFIRDYITEDDLVFLYYKRVEVISGR